ncbi:MAG: hypothetical protein V1911_01100 [Candidatus Micrarchaeota archaeon]
MEQNTQPQQPNFEIPERADFTLVEVASNPEWKQMLIDVVEKSGMDPWDIDVSLLVVRFMEYLNSLKKIDFRIPANAVLASSILLRYKCDSWEMRTDGGDIMQMMYVPDQILLEPIVPDLEPVMRATKRRVSLEELITAIEDVIKKEGKKAMRREMNISEVLPKPLMEMIESDEKDFERRIDDVYNLIKKNVDKTNMAMFSQLLPNRQVDSVIRVFVPLLHLANSRRVAVWQDNYFDEIFIKLPENGNVSSGNGGNGSGNGKEGKNGGSA